jgi:molybdate transport system ATP-binding protein
MLEVDIQRRLGSFDLEPSFEAADELVVLYGPSGCGKSLTLKAVAGLLKPDAGRIILPGGTVAFDAAQHIDLPPQQRRAGYVVQELALFPHLSARANIEIGKFTTIGPTLFLIGGSERRYAITASPSSSLMVLA